LQRSIVPTPQSDKQDPHKMNANHSTASARQDEPTSDMDVVRDLPPEAVIFGISDAMRELRGKIEKVADTKVPVLIQGESGTGKEIVAKLLHQWAPWHRSPFVKINCPAIPSTLIESELFGYERGAFTGAHGHKPGRVEQAHQGTLFLDEIAELDSSLQSKLLQLLQDGQYYPIGGQKEKRVEVRVICATNRDLESEIDLGRFRRDLFYRINVVSVMLPALRERTCDIASLMNYFLQFYSDKFKRHARSLSAKTLRGLEQHSWPGNIRELENLIKRYVILGSEEVISIELASRNHHNNHNQGEPEVVFDGSVPLRKLTRQAARRFEHNIILKVLQSRSWNRKEAARTLNISYRALLYKLKEANLASRRGSGPQPSGMAND
jgi:two-component system response regulator AtoC